MNKQQMNGRIDEAKGKVMEVTGKMLGNEKLELRGKIQKKAGQVRAGVGDVAEDINHPSKAL
ncbi:CsbD family protein [Thiorhodovibrio winogradskyi]|nr:CsbD family protein [Thiorhodovibrio winogradskyi]